MFVLYDIQFIYSCSILWRFWLSHFDIELSVAVSSREWQRFIDERAQFDNWYFRKQSTFGDYSWTKRRFLWGTVLIIVFFILLFVPFPFFSISVFSDFIFFRFSNSDKFRNSECSILWFFCALKLQKFGDSKCLHFWCSVNLWVHWVRASNSY